MPIYESYDDGRGVLRSYANNGNSSMFVLGANFTFRLFDRSLQIQAGPTYMYAENTGIYPVSKSNFRGTVQASYFLKGFYASAAYYSPYRYLSKEGVYHRHKTPEYIIELGWSNSDWNVRALFKNFFESTWIEGSSIYETPFYSTLSDQYGINRHRQVSLHVTYTFGYGRRIDRGNEMGGGSGGSNAILK